MDFFEGEYPPNPTGMTEENYKAGIDVLQSLLSLPTETDKDDILKHIDKVLNYSGVDAALYLLYYGHQVREVMTTGIVTETQRVMAFRVLLQTAVSIGAYISKNELDTIDKLDKLWDTIAKEKLDEYNS